MALSILFKSPGVTTDTSLPVAKTDLLINAGSLFLLDFLRLGSWNPATDTVANDAVVRNLVPGAPSALLKIPVAGDLTFVSGLGFQLSATNALGRVQIGTGTQYFQSNLTRDFLLTAWVTYPAVDPTANTGFIFTKGTASNYFCDGPYLAARYLNGGDMSGRMDSVTNANGASKNTLGSPAGKHQFGIAKVGGNVVFFRDGVQVHSAVLGATALTANAVPLNFGNGGSASQFACPGAILHRTYGEDLTISGLTAAAVVAADYAANSGRFSV